MLMLEEFKKAPINDCNEFLNSRFRIIGYFKFTRSLNYGIFKKYEEENVKSGIYNLKMTFKDCLEFHLTNNKLFTL
jgi:hypothetical protein